MEDVLEVYQRPHDPARPVVCLDETSKQLIAETRVPITAKPGRAARFDYEYRRNGTANLFMMFAPLEGWRHVKVTDHRAAVDYAHVLKELSDTHFPGADKIVLMQDNLNIHKPASLYEAFPAAEARRLVETLRVALHAQTRQLAEHGRSRTRHLVGPVSRSAYPRPATPDRRSRSMAARPQQTPRQSGLALHHCRRTGEAEEAIPRLMNDSGY